MDVKYSIGNIVNNIVMSMYDVRWVWDLLDWLLSKSYNVWSLRSMPETNDIVCQL